MQDPRYHPNHPQHRELMLACCATGTCHRTPALTAAAIAHEANTHWREHCHHVSIEHPGIVRIIDYAGRLIAIGEDQPGIWRADIYPHPLHFAHGCQPTESEQLDSATLPRLVSHATAIANRVPTNAAPEPPRCENCNTTSDPTTVQRADLTVQCRPCYRAGLAHGHAHVDHDSPVEDCPTCEAEQAAQQAEQEGHPND